MMMIMMMIVIIIIIIIVITVVVFIVVIVGIIYYHYYCCNRIAKVCNGVCWSGSEFGPDLWRTPPYPSSILSKTFFPLLL